MRKILPMMSVALAALGAFAAPIQGTVSVEGDAKTGTVKWNRRDKTYTVSQKQGKGTVDVQIALADVTELAIAKPAGIDAAIAQVERGQGAAAVGILANIVK